MKNEMIKIFENEEFGNVKTVVINNEPYFVGKDVAEILGYKEPNKAISKHIDVDDRTKYPIIDAIGRAQETWVINESGLYSLILSSKLPSAKQFKRWVTSEVLPNIRKVAKTLEEITFQGSIDDLVYSKNGKPTTKSTSVAKLFDKKHKHILEVIDNKLKSNNKTIAEFSAMNFFITEYLSENGHIYREYEMTEEGFNFIALGFTGEKAEIYKIKYIQAFSKMKEYIVNMFKARLIENVLPQDNRNRQFVYIIENADNGAIKIGVAHSPQKRLNQLQTGSVSELSLVYTSYVCSNAFDIENKVHTHFKDKHIRGEWYNVPKDEVISFLEQQRFVLKSEFVKYISLIQK